MDTERIRKVLTDALAYTYLNEEAQDVEYPDLRAEIAELLALLDGE